MNEGYQGEEVSGDILQLFRDIAARTQYDERTLFAGYESFLEKPPKYFSWDDACVLFDRLSDACEGVCTVEEAGAAAHDSEGFKAHLSIMRWVANPKLLYRMVFRWAGPRIFRNTHADYEERDDGSIVARLTINEGYRPCPNFFRINFGSCLGLPNILGLGNADISTTVHDDHCWTFVIIPPDSMTLASRLGHWFKTLFNSSAVIAELTQQRAELTESFREVKRALGEAERQRHLAEAAQQKTERALLVKSQFISTIGHELRTPLNGILGAASCLTSETIEDDEMLEVIADCARKLESLIDDTLDFSDLEGGQFRLDRAYFDIHDLFARVRNLFSARAEDKGIILNLDPLDCDGDCEFLGDIQKIYRILFNLVDNALKFTSKGSVTVSAQWQTNPNLVLKAARAENNDDSAVAGHLLLIVQDTGSGIPDAALKEIFEPFTQADGSSTRVHGGMGLGLAMSKTLALAMGGSIEIDSKVGKGTHAWLSIPARRKNALQPLVSRRAIDETETSQGAATAQSRAHPKASTKEVATMRILVVDDNKINRVVLSRMLVKAGHDVETAVNGQEAVDLVSTQDFHLVLMDLEMPVMDGFAAATAIRSLDGPKADIPIVAVTAYADQDNRDKSASCGMNRFVAKPVNNEKVFSIVEEFHPESEKFLKAA